MMTPPEGNLVSLLLYFPFQQYIEPNHLIVPSKNQRYFSFTEIFDFCWGFFQGSILYKCNFENKQYVLTIFPVLRKFLSMFQLLSSISDVTGFKQLGSGPARVLSVGVGFGSGFCLFQKTGSGFTMSGFGFLTGFKFIQERGTFWEKIRKF